MFSEIKIKIYEIFQVIVSKCFFNDTILMIETMKRNLHSMPSIVNRGIYGLENVFTTESFTYSSSNQSTGLHLMLLFDQSEQRIIPRLCSAIAAITQHYNVGKKDKIENKHLC